MAEVLIRAPDGEQRIALKSGTLSVGRERFNDVVINDPKASRKHAQIEKIGEQWIITDLGSSNGTYLRGERISQVIIHEMDIFSIGAVQMVFTGVEEKVADDLMPTTMASAEVLMAKMDAMAQARTAQAAPLSAPAAPPPAPKPAVEAAKKITDAMDEEVAEQGTVAIQADQAAIAQPPPPPPAITPGLSNPFSSAAPPGAGPQGLINNVAPPGAPAPAAPTNNQGASMSTGTVHKPEANPVIAALLCLVLNLGHFVINGQQRKWLFILLAIIVGEFLCLLPGLFIMILSILDAYQTAERLQKGETIGENEYTFPLLFKIMSKIDKTATCAKA